MSKKVHFANNSFAFVKGNRETASNKALESSIKANGVLVPIQVARYADVKDLNIQLVDPFTGVDIISPADNTIVIFDGQHRFLYSHHLYDEMKQRDNQTNDTYVEDGIPADYVDLCKIKNMNDVLTWISIVNATPKNWTSRDYIGSAHYRKSDDSLIKAINYLKDLGLSISVISLFLFFDKRALSPATLMDYVRGQRDFSNANPQRGLEIFRMLLDKGFNIKFLKKRYMIEQIIRQHNRSYEAFKSFLNAICSVNDEVVTKIEKEMSFEDYVNDEIYRVIIENASSVGSNETDSEAGGAISSEYTLEVTDEKYLENLEFLKAEVVKFFEQKQLKAVKKKRVTAIKRSGKCRESALACTYDEIK